MKLYKRFRANREVLLRGLILVASVLLLLMVISIGANVGDSKGGEAPTFPHAGLSIERADGKYFTYAVEVATTKEQDAYGLMFRHDMLPETGMIFVYQPDQAVSMWMKNTFIPLDMLFVRKDGVIVKIATHAQPLDVTPIPAGEPVRAVIEINAGDVEKHGFKTGDKVLFSAFSSPS